MSDYQQRRVAAGLCRQCGKPMDRKAVHGGHRAVYCKACVVSRKTVAKARVDKFKGAAVEQMRKALGLPPEGEA